MIAFKDLFIARSGLSVSNRLVITNGGQIQVTNSTATVRVGYDNTNGFDNIVAVFNGGLLETPTMSIDQGTTGPVNPAPTGDCITNAGGIYQFATATPAITPGANGRVYLASGTIAFRGVSTADVKANWSGSQLTNISYSGRNAFRLNTASNTASSSQSYLFDDVGNATNWTRLEMVGGATRYRGQAGNTLTIGASGAMLVSNTTAAVDLAFTNNGTLTLVNSTLALNSAATLAGTLVVDLNHLGAGTPVTAQALTIAPGSILHVTGTPTNTTLCTYTSRSGTFAVEGLPATYVVRHGSPSGGAITLQAAPPGLSLIVF